MPYTKRSYLSSYALSINVIIMLITISDYCVNYCEGYPNPRSFVEDNIENNNVTLVKGDIIFRNNPVSFYMAPKDKYRLWTNRIIPYTLDPGYNEFHQERIISAMEAIEEETCIRFVKRRKEFDYVLIVNKKGGCFSDVGRIGGLQMISLHTSCLSNGIGVTVHELLHTLGLWHEHNRPDRDQRVKIIFDNIIPKPVKRTINFIRGPNRYLAAVGSTMLSRTITFYLNSKDKRFNFEKNEENIVDLLGFEYDYGSIMHYGNDDFSVNGGKTIQVLQAEYDRVIGQRIAMSETDINKINALYKCEIMTCPNPVEVENGKIISSGPYMVGDNVRYRCNPGTSAVGSSVRTCKFDGQWSGFLLRCLVQSTFVWCDFESDLCGFTHHDDNDFNWNRMSTGLELEYAAPLVDHTTEETQGFYVYAESEIQKPGQISKLISPELEIESREETATVCLSFSYSMWGGTGQMGTLTVIVINQEGSRELANIEGNQGPQWLPIEITFKSKTPVKIIFEAVLGSVLYSDIAVDNFLFRSCPNGHQSEYDIKN